MTWIDISAENAFHQYIFEAPVDDSHTRIFFINMRSWLLEDEHDERIEKPTLQIVHEDLDILEKLRPIRTPTTNTKEILVPGDTVVVRYREWLAEWDANGWRIDYKALQAQKGDIAFAIPISGPTRRRKLGAGYDSTAGRAVRRPGNGEYRRSFDRGHSGFCAAGSLFVSPLSVRHTCPARASCRGHPVCAQRGPAAE